MPRIMLMKAGDNQCGLAPQDELPPWLEVVAANDSSAWRTPAGIVESRLVPLRFAEGLWPDGWASLPPRDQARLAQIRHLGAQKESAVGRLAVRAWLAPLLCCRPEEIQFQIRPDGKPILDPIVHAGAGWYFNVSHTREWVAVALGRVPVGIDIEIRRLQLDLAGLASRYFLPEEAIAWARLPRELQIESFFRAWTVKEAVLKADGCGLQGLSWCGVEMDPRLPVRLTGDQHRVSRWQVQHNHGFQQHHIALAWEETTSWIA